MTKLRRLPFTSSAIFLPERETWRAGGAARAERRDGAAGASARPLRWATSRSGGAGIKKW